MRLMPVCAALVAALSVSACGGGPSNPSGPTGTLNLRLTDSPFTDAQAVLVTFSAVSAHLADGDWEPVDFAGGAPSRTCDLKLLQGGADDILGTDTLTAGTYTQIRLVIDSVTLYFDNPSAGPTACAASITEPLGDSADVEVPSGEVKLNPRGGLAIEPGGTTTILLDLDGDRSIIHQTGNDRYIMNPVLTIAEVNGVPE